MTTPGEPVEDSDEYFIIPELTIRKDALKAYHAFRIISCPKPRTSNDTLIICASQSTLEAKLGDVWEALIPNAPTSRIYKIYELITNFLKTGELPEESVAEKSHNSEFSYEHGVITYNLDTGEITAPFPCRDLDNDRTLETHIRHWIDKQKQLQIQIWALELGLTEISIDQMKKLFYGFNVHSIAHLTFEVSKTFTATLISTTQTNDLPVRRDIQLSASEKTHHVKSKCEKLAQKILSEIEL